MFGKILNIQSAVIIIILFCAANLYSQNSVPGNALKFNGVDDYLTFHTHLTVTENYTIEGWFKADVQNKTMDIFSAANAEHGILIEQSADGRIRYLHKVPAGSTGGVDIYSGRTYNDKEWHHFAAVKKDSTITLFMDGNKEATVTNGNQITNATDSLTLVLGRLGINNSARYFNGQIDELSIWNVARSIQDIRESMHLTYNGNETGLANYWQFNDTTGLGVAEPVGGNYGILFNMSASCRVTSTLPIGGGKSFTQIVSSTGEFNFTETSLSINFTEKTGTDTVVVTKLEQSPNKIPSSFIVYDNQYWLVNRFGAGTFNANLTFTIAEEIKPKDETTPEIFGLLSRTTNSGGNWNNSMGAATVNASSKSIRYDNVITFSQFLIGRHYFTEINAGLPMAAGSYSGCDVDWVDFDMDGDLDISIAGNSDGGGVNRTALFRNNGDDSFTEVNVGFPMAAGIHSGCSVEWVDYDNDGDPDVLIGGTGNDGGIDRTALYRNNGDDTFTEINAGLPFPAGKNSGCSIECLDIDNDGFQDVLLAGNSGSGGLDRVALFKNNGNDSFSEINLSIPQPTTSNSDCSIKWIDYDKDGDSDFIVAGRFLGVLYRNNGDYNFTKIKSDFPKAAGNFSGCSIAWGDYDNDGDPDILLGGNNSYGGLKRTALFRNNGDDTFTEINAELPMASGNFSDCSLEWGDYDNDGLLDILIAGNNYGGGLNRTALFRNNGDDTFTEISVGLPMAAGEDSGCSIDWGDYDNDGDLDILIAGNNYGGGINRTAIYRNNINLPNTKPNQPNGLSASAFAGSIHLSWEKATDNETPQDGLSYNLVIGNNEFDILFSSPSADLTNGYRLVNETGNMNQISSWKFEIPESYLFPHVALPNYWGVQAIDHSFAGSAFTLDSLTNIHWYLPTNNNSIMQSQDDISWQIINGDSIVSYQVQIDDDSTFSSNEVDDTLHVSQNNIEGLFSISLQELNGSDALIAGTKYYWRMKPNYTFELPTVFTSPAPSFWFKFITDIEDGKDSAISTEFGLQQNYPNPFNPVTTINYELPEATNVDISIYNLLGQKITTLVTGIKQAGYYNVKWNASQFSSGIYIYKIKTENGFTDSKKLMLLK